MTVKSCMAEIQHMLDSKKVVGEPIRINENTVIPLLSIGFGFGGGGGPAKGEKAAKGESGMAGTGGFGGIKPVAMIIVNKKGVRLETIKGSASSVVEQASGVLEKAMSREQTQQEE